ncbi:MAG: transposon-encoded TnpW family protein [Oscillospiraceae bacterium]|jgi:hypothetical protein|nr:transposon-encoded TnpW family protein [Oscillospiraceae bacterium]
MSNKPYATELRAEIDKTMDWLCELPDDKIRCLFGNKRIPRGIDFRQKVGGTQYIVTSHFNQTAEDDMIHKIKRLIVSDISYEV